ncbi:MAG: Glycosyl transferase family 2 [Parcubacteria group bacterium GW2011_GWA1_47_8]|nr:MAG: Glycosyl transferase family 2 [Parcubacteria group bacterium GW2011_GWA1_47_8]
MENRKLSIIVPVYNEEKTVGEVIRRLLAVPFVGWAAEIIVVNDGSTDGTASVLAGFSSRARIINLSKNGGKGGAVSAGLKVANGDFAVIQDADLECSPEEIPLLLSALGTRDIRAKVAVIGSRELYRENKKRASLSRFGSLFITKLINALYGSFLTDASMCYKLFPKATFGYFAAGGFEAELIFVTRLLKEGYHIIEVPVSYIPRGTDAGKKIRYRDGITIIMRILLFRIAGR